MSIVQFKGAMAAVTIVKSRFTVLSTRKKSKIGGSEYWCFQGSPRLKSTRRTTTGERKRHWLFCFSSTRASYRWKPCICCTW
mmetsp:Transcript_1620/g.2528  ORF Transcript_1620/g.2528 Transcript_1620/m.2528 type:complete len:82 (-) Transcript_1620:798-1043(-)